MSAWRFIIMRIRALRGTAQLVLNKETTSISSTVDAVSTHSVLNKTKEKNDTSMAWNARTHMPRNLKSLYGSYKLITCLTSLVNWRTPNVLSSQNHSYSYFFYRFLFLVFFLFNTPRQADLCFTYRYVFCSYSSHVRWQIWN